MRRSGSALPPSQRPDEQERPRRLAANAAWRIAATVVRVLIGIVSVSAFTRVLGMGQWGLLALFQAATGPLALLDALAHATVKYTAESLGRGDRAEAARVVQTTLMFNLVVGCAGAAALLVSSGWLASSVFAIPTEDVGRAVTGFRLVGALWFLGLITATYAGVLAAHQRYDTTSKLTTLSVVASNGLALAFAAAFRDIRLVLVAQTLASAVMVVVYFRAAARLLPELAAPPRGDGAVFRRSFGFGVWQIVGVGGSLLASWGDRYVLGALFAPTVVGFYATASLLQTQLYGAFIEMGEVLFPAVSHLEGRGELPAARRLALLAGWAVTSGLAVCAAVLAAIGGDFLHLWISDEVARGTTTTLRLLCVASIAGITAIGPFYYLLGTGRTRWDAVSGITGGLTVIGVSVLVVPRYGLAGVGYGALAASLVRWGFVALIWRRHFRSDYTFAGFSAHVWLPALSGAAILLLLSGCHDALGVHPSWPWLVLEGAVSLLIAAGLQLGANELMPGGGQRRHDVVASFRPVIAAAIGLVWRRA